MCRKVSWKRQAIIEYWCLDSALTNRYLMLNKKDILLEQLSFIVSYMHLPVGK